MAKFNRGLKSSKFIQQLADEARKPSWWADVLGDRELFVAVRKDNLNVYWHGQSLFRVGPGLRVTTHPKYLLDPALKSQVSLTGHNFDVTSIEKGLIREYSGRETLDKMKKASGLFSGLEKTGCHEIAIRNPAVIDCEIAFGDDAEKTTSSGGDPVTQPNEPAREGKSGAPRADLATIEPEGDSGARLVFWEAKHYTNRELRAEDGRPVPVWDQVKRYQKCLSENHKAVLDSYTKVAANLVAFRDMGLQRRLSPLIAEVGTGNRRLTLDQEPKVGLVIFGFDQAQKDYPKWEHHLKRLRLNIEPVVAAGDAKKILLKL